MRARDVPKGAAKPAINLVFFDIAFGVILFRLRVLHRQVTNTLSL